MAKIVHACATAHLPGLTGWFDKASPKSQRAIRQTYERVGESLRAERPDVVIMVANDHLLNYHPADYPDFVVGTAAEHVGPAEWFRPWLQLDEYRMPGAPDTARTIHEHLDGKDLHVTESEELSFDDNISVPVTLTGFSATGIPIIPLIQNCTVPPVPDERTCYQVGRRLGQTIREHLPEEGRVALYGSGGMSHEPGGPRYLEIDEEFDRWFLQLLEEGDHEKVLTEATFERMEQAGAGGTAELLSWLLVMGAIGERPCNVLCYEAVPEWRCGAGAVQWSL